MYRSPSDIVSFPFPDVICLSHLRWQFVFQRPQHLMTRYARRQRVFFVEEPVCDDVVDVEIKVEPRDGVFVVVPVLPRSFSREQSIRAQRLVLDTLIATHGINRYILWYYTPMALAFSDHLSPIAVVYDCMDELSAFKNAPAELRTREQALMRIADVMLAGGRSLFEAKRHQHPNVHALPSSVDVTHFRTARTIQEEPLDQYKIPTPRLGFFGVLDERLDIPLLDKIAEARPDWQWMLLGPIVKIDPSELPRRPNIHYLGPKPYEQLPAYLAGWNAALLLFARNEATRFISPTKTPEYLAAGKPVISTSIADVVNPYGERGLVWIADDPSAFIDACEQALTEPAGVRQARADLFLSSMSWDRTWSKSAALLDEAIAAKSAVLKRRPEASLASEAR
jgi:UDP-galactopyranose mutase